MWKRYLLKLFLAFGSSEAEACSVDKREIYKY